MATVIELKGVSKGFQDGDEIRWLFNDLDLTIQRGEIAVLWGPSGCGKTTLLNMLAGMEPPDKGQIRVQLGANSIDLTETTKKELLTYRREHIGYIYQFFNLVPTLTLHENVSMRLALAGKKTDHGSVKQRLQDIDLDHRADAFPDALSGGEQQRAACVREVLHNPQIVLADEPTGNLDEASAAKVVATLQNLAQQRSTTLIVASHDRVFRDLASQVIEL